MSFPVVHFVFFCVLNARTGFLPSIFAFLDSRKVVSIASLGRPGETLRPTSTENLYMLRPLLPISAKNAKLDGRMRFLSSKIAKIVKMDDRKQFLPSKPA